MNGKKEWRHQEKQMEKRYQRREGENERTTRQRNEEKLDGR